MSVNITLLPDVPSRNDSPTTFATKANNFLAALPTFVNELNAYAPQVLAASVNGNFDINNGNLDVTSDTSAWVLDVNNTNSTTGGTIKTSNVITVNPTTTFALNKFDLIRTQTAATSVVTKTIDVTASVNQNGFNHSGTRQGGGPAPARLYLEAAGASGTIDNLVTVLSDIRNVGAGNVTNMIAYTSNFGNTGGGTVGSTFSFYAPNEGNGTSNYAFYTDMVSGTNSYAFYGAGNAPSYLGGNLTVGGTITSTGAMSALAGIAVTGNITGTGLITTSSGTGGIGYATGAGGSVTQTTSRTTTVPLSKPCGTITLFSTTTTAGQMTEFTFTNARIAATDVVVFSQKSGAGTYFVQTRTIGAGTCVVSVYTPVAVATAEAPSFNFAIIKGVTT